MVLKIFKVHVTTGNATEMAIKTGHMERTILSS